jgi:general secretion pathway protein L
MASLERHALSSPAAGLQYIRRDGPPGSDWVAFSPAGVVLGRGTLRGIAAAGTSVCLLAPSPDARICEVDIPTRSRSRALQAVPFAVEETLAADLSTVSLAVGEVTASGKYPVALVAKTRLAGWLSELESAGISVARVVPELLSLPLLEDRITVAVDGDRILLRWSEGEGASVEAKHLSALIDGLNTDRPAAMQVTPAMVDSLHIGKIGHIGQNGQNGQDGQVGQVGYLGPVPMNPGPQEVASLYVALAAGAAVISAHLDFMQGSAASIGAELNGFRPWRWVAVGVVALLAISVVQVFIEVNALESQRDEWETRVAALYSQTFPGSRVPQDVGRVVRQRAAELGVDAHNGTREEALSGLMPLLAVVAQHTKPSRAIQLAGLRYQAGALDVDLRAPSLQELEQWRRAIDDSEGNVTTQSLSMLATPDGATARMRVSSRQ